jgi:hypothetical protein
MCRQNSIEGWTSIKTNRTRRTAELPAPPLPARHRHCQKGMGALASMKREPPERFTATDARTPPPPSPPSVASEMWLCIAPASAGCPAAHHRLSPRPPPATAAPLPCPSDRGRRGRRRATSPPAPPPAHPLRRRRRPAALPRAAAPCVGSQTRPPTTSAGLGVASAPPRPPPHRPRRLQPRCQACRTAGARPGADAPAARAAVGVAAAAAGGPSAALLLCPGVPILNIS